VYYVFRYRRDVVKENLQRSFKKNPPKELLKIEKKFYHHFCDVLFESLKTLSISKSDFKKRFKFRNPDLLQQLYDEDKSIILYAAHQGNWEWFSSLPLLAPSYQVLSFYQPLSNKYFDGLMKTIRERFGVICIESNKGFKTLLHYRSKKIKTMCLVIGDQSPSKTSTKHWTYFFETETAFLTGAEKMAEKIEQVLVFPSIKKIKRGYYEVEFILIEKNNTENAHFSMTDSYAKNLEQSIKKSPELWLWSHKRWKLKPEKNK
jgi:KDO2-lipid IV(A) lauroyltransferase